MEQSGVGVVKGIELQDDALGQAGSRGGDATGRGEVGAALVGALVDAAHFEDGPVELAVESVAHALAHVAQVHVLVVHLAQIGVGAEVLVGGERCAESDGVGIGHVALDALARRGAGVDAHGKGPSRLVLADGTAG